LAWHRSQNGDWPWDSHTDDHIGLMDHLGIDRTIRG
jgi:hypothetical protein